MYDELYERENESSVVWFSSMEEAIDYVTLNDYPEYEDDEETAY